MSFFFPGQTECKICSRPIRDRMDAMQFDHAYNKDVGEFAKFARSYGHQRCWDNWSHRKPYAASSREARLRHDADGGGSAILGESAGVFLYQRGDGYSLEDVESPLVLDIAPKDAEKVPNWLGEVLPKPSLKEMTLDLENYGLIARWIRGDLVIILQAGQRPIQQVVLHKERRTAWLGALAHCGGSG